MASKLKTDFDFKNAIFQKIEKLDKMQRKRSADFHFFNKMLKF